MWAPPLYICVSLCPLFLSGNQTLDLLPTLIQYDRILVISAKTLDTNKLHNEAPGGHGLLGGNTYSTHYGIFLSAADVPS